MQTVNGAASRSSLGRYFGFIACIYGLIALPVATVSGEYGDVAGAWRVAYGDDTAGEALTEFHLGSKHTKELNVTIYDVDLTLNDLDFYFQVWVKNEQLAYADKRIERSDLEATSDNKANWQGAVSVRGRYFGYTRLYVSLHAANGTVEQSKQTLRVTVLRDAKLNDKIFTYTAAAIVLLMFINLGTALDLQRLKSILTRPIAPIIGFCTSYILMPSLGLGLGMLCFPRSKHLQLALFFTALSPSGGLANICTVFLKGNINLSIATTTLNSLMALVMLPLWILVLAQVVYSEHNLSVPFEEVAVGAGALLFALSLGVLVRFCFPISTRYIIRFLKPLSVALSSCLVALTLGINFFAFKEFTWVIFAAGLFLPLLGYWISFSIALILRRSITDALTIAIESSVLNMSVPIAMLEYSLPEPLDDMAVIVPIMAALTSLCLVVIFYTVRRIFGWNKKVDEEAFDDKEFDTLSSDYSSPTVYDVNQ